MNYNLKRHKVLSTMVMNCREKKVIAEFPQNYYQLLQDCEMNYDDFSNVLNCLHAEDYVTFSNIGNENLDVHLTKKGVLAGSSNFFKIENNKAVWTIIRDATMIAANLAVAIIAYFALKN